MDKAEKTRLRKELHEEQERHTKELKSMREAYLQKTKEREEEYAREQEKLEKALQDKLRIKEELREKEHLQEIRQLEENYEREEKKRAEAHRQEILKLEEALLRKDKERELKHRHQWDEMTRIVEQQLKLANDAWQVAEKGRILGDDDRIKNQLMEKRLQAQKRQELESEMRFKIEATENEKNKIKELREELKTLKPGDSLEYPPENIVFPEKYNVGLFGTTGIGKSSLLNSLKFAFKGKLDELSWEQTSTDIFQGGNTVRRLEVQITRHLVFIDNRGIGAEDLENIDSSKEIISQLEGTSSFAEKVSWHNPVRKKIWKPKPDRRVYCTILVFDAQNPRGVYSSLPKIVGTIFRWQGRYPIGVLTHVDVATVQQMEEMYIILRTAGIVDIYDVANITDRRQELQLDHQLNLLRLMRLCIKQGDRIFCLRKAIEEEEEKEAKE